MNTKAVEEGLAAFKEANDSFLVAAETGDIRALAEGLQALTALAIKQIKETLEEDEKS